jgi:DNA ligase (NAD+)
MYQVLPDAHPPISKLTELELVRRMGFTTPFFTSLNGTDQIEDVYQQYIESSRENLDYDIDGLVVEVNLTSQAEALGMLNNRPKGAIAYKFPHAMADTILRDVLWQVGNTGRITPVAIFDPVVLDGAKITRASLANSRRFSDLRLTRGCRIRVSRRNQVIPYVESNLDV